MTTTYPTEADATPARALRGTGLVHALERNADGTVQALCKRGPRRERLWSYVDGAAVTCAHCRRMMEH